MLLFLPPFHSQTLYLSFWQGVMLRRLTFPGLIRKGQYLSYTPTVSSACSFWQVSAPSPTFQPCLALFLSAPHLTTSSALRTTWSCTTQEYLGARLSPVMPEWGHSGLLVKLSLALNSLQQPASSRIPEKEAYKLDRSPPKLSHPP